MGHPRIPRQAAVFAAFAPLVLAGCSTTTYGTGQSPEMALVSELTGGIGLPGTRKKKEPIDYQPRAPLVMPPAQAQLPEPIATASTSNPDWPVDPNDRSLASAAQFDGDVRNDVSPEEYRRLRPLSPVFAAAGKNVTTPSNNDLNNDRAEYYQNIVHGNEQRKRFRADVADTKGYGRSDRRYLTDPPVAYREPAATAPQAYAEAKAGKKKGFLRRWFGGGGDAEETAVAPETPPALDEAQL